MQDGRPSDIAACRSRIGPVGRRVRISALPRGNMFDSVGAAGVGVGQAMFLTATRNTAKN